MFRYFTPLLQRMSELRVETKKSYNLVYFIAVAEADKKSKIF